MTYPGGVINPIKIHMFLHIMDCKRFIFQQYKLLVHDYEIKSSTVVLHNIISR